MLRCFTCGSRNTELPGRKPEQLLCGVCHNQTLEREVSSPTWGAQAAAGTVLGAAFGGAFGGFLEAAVGGVIGFLVGASGHHSKLDGRGHLCVSCQTTTGHHRLDRYISGLDQLRALRAAGASLADQDDARNDLQTVYDQLSDDEKRAADASWWRGWPDGLAGVAIDIDRHGSV